jgi:uncharacterized protein (DUF433 family)
MSLLWSRHGRVPLPHLWLLPASHIGLPIFPEAGILPRYQYFGRIIEIKKMYKGMIQSDPSVMMGKPVIAGTRITVELIVEKLAAGETVEQILEAHPRLTREAIQAALAFAAEALRADVVYPLPERGR